MDSITWGNHSYCSGEIIPFFSPIVTIGKYCSIAEKVTFMGLCQHPSAVNKDLVANFIFGDLKWEGYPPVSTKGNITIDNDVWIGRNAVIMDGVHIGDGAIIGAEAVVASEVKPYSIVVGNPAREVKKRFSDEIIEKLLKIKWWDWPEETIHKNLLDFLDINKFVTKYGGD